MLRYSFAVKNAPDLASDETSLTSTFASMSFTVYSSVGIESKRFKRSRSRTSWPESWPNVASPNLSVISLSRRVARLLRVANTDPLSISSPLVARYTRTADKSENMN